jgi:SPP1 gp7 family putative phage head morphogenesis protein
MCDVCGFTNISNSVQSPFTEADYNAFIDGVYKGEISKYSLPSWVYTKTFQHLNKGVFEGFGQDLITVAFETPDYWMLKDLTENIYMFSGAKTYQQYRSLSDLLLENKANYYKFKDAATSVLKDYNEVYLAAEYRTAIGSARMAGEWQRITQDADVLPLLQYKTVGDGRVRPEHAQLNNIVRRVDDKFWDTLYPPNGWNCRCTVMQLADGDVTDLRGKKLYENVPKEFRFNVGKDRIIFNDKGSNKHPYYKIAKGDKDFARENFGLPIPR